MDDFRPQLADVLGASAAAFRAAGLPAGLAAAADALAGQLGEPCVVAVAGRMNAGKSTFLNALLGADLARVGAVETTATVNHFRYGTPADPARPVRCVWRGGRTTEETAEFLAGLQGNDAESLRRADRVERLEYRLPHPALREVTLVDTPGTGAAVADHQTRTDEFLRLRAAVRDRHDRESRRLAGEADAVIYLVGPVARETDEQLLAAFTEAAGGRARSANALGVLAKVDLDPELLARRHALAAKIAGQLRDSVTAVVPVSAGLRRAVDDLRAGGRLHRFLATAGRIPPAAWERFLLSEDLYLDGERPDGPVPPAERAALLGSMPWGVFTALVRLARECAFDPAETERRADEVAGFGPLRDLLDRQFLARGRFLRCHRVAADARRLLNEVRFAHAGPLEDRDRADADRLGRFRRFVRLARGDAGVAAELEAYLDESLSGGRGRRVVAALDDLSGRLARVAHALEQHNADFEALAELDAAGGEFTIPEADELRGLFGQYGLEPERRVPAGRLTVAYVAARQERWQRVGEDDRSAARRRVGDRAATRYGLLLAGLLG